MLTTEDIAFARQLHNTYLQQLESQFSRPMASRMAWNERLLGIMGARGVGKTTLLLQHIHDRYGLGTEALYVSLDNLSFVQGDLFRLAEMCWQQGVEALFLDEVHKFANWSQELKMVYDVYPRLRVVFTGSSLLHIIQGNADLSRRAVVYHLAGLSFREYVQVQTGKSFEPIALPDLLKNHVAMASEIVKEIKPLKLLKEYWHSGYYPYFLQGPDTYPQKLIGTMMQMLEFDIPYLRNVEIRSVNKLKQLLNLLSRSAPFKPNVVQLADALGMSRNGVMNFLHHLQDAEIIRLLYPAGALYSRLKKPEKVYLWHPNHIYVMGGARADLGNLRETFFCNQVGAMHSIGSASQGDFTVDEKYVFEVGGKNKNGAQIKGVENAWVALDDVETGFDNKIPLWMMGWLY